jgi:hypothetical protein
MEKFWKAALAVAGLGAVGAFVFWSLYKQWLSLGIFANLTSQQTFIVMLVFLALTFVFAVTAFITYAKTHVGAPGFTGSSYSVPKGRTFQSTAEQIARRQNIEFEGFTDSELSAPLQAKEFQASDDREALRQLRLLAAGRVRPYGVESDRSGKLILRII